MPFPKNHLILENDEFFAIPEKNAVNPGHTVIVLKKEVDYFFDLDDQTLGKMMIFSKKVAGALKAAFPCRKIGVMVGGLVVRRAHLHLVPLLESVSELSFARAKVTPDESLAKTAQSIRERL